MRASIWTHNSQVVNDNHSLSSRLSIHFNSLWISTRSQLDSVYLPHVFFLRFNWAIVSRYEIKSGPCVCSFVSGVWYSNRYRNIYIPSGRSRILGKRGLHKQLTKYSIEISVNSSAPVWLCLQRILRKAAENFLGLTPGLLHLCKWF